MMIEIINIIESIILGYFVGYLTAKRKYKRLLK